MLEPSVHTNHDDGHYPKSDVQSQNVTVEVLNAEDLARPRQIHGRIN